MIIKCLIKRFGESNIGQPGLKNSYSKCEIRNCALSSRPLVW